MYHIKFTDGTSRSYAREGYALKVAESDGADHVIDDEGVVVWAAGPLEDRMTKVKAENLEPGKIVLSGRKGHPPVEIARVRIGRKHVTAYDPADRDVLWVPVGTKVQAA
jgi:hypothetical protein